MTMPGDENTGTDNFELVYQGPEVEDGTMDARQLAEVLTGTDPLLKQLLQLGAIEQNSDGDAQSFLLDADSHDLRSSDLDQDCLASSRVPRCPHRRRALPHD